MSTIDYAERLAEIEIEASKNNPKDRNNKNKPDLKKISKKTDDPKNIDNSNKKSKNKTYKVQKGDTLYSIAKKNNVSVENLMHHNKIKSPKDLRDGAVLQIP